MTKYMNYDRVESTPFVYFDIKETKNHKGGWFRLYWSKNSGTYGYQVSYEGNDYNKEEGYFHGKTGGYGYSKEASALKSCLRELGFKAPSCHYETSYLFNRYGNGKNKSLHVGGNYYTGTVNQIKQFLKLVK